MSWRKDGLISATITRRRASLLLSPAGKVRGSVAVMNPFWAPDSRRAAYVDHSQIYIWPDSTVVGGGNNFVSAPTWSPFGDRLAFARVVATTGGFHSELVVVGAGGGEEQVIFAAAPIGQPEWSPDGALLTFVADATPNLYVATPDGATVRKLTVGFRHAGDLPTWSPDSRWIAFTATRGSRYALYVIRPDGNGLHQIAPHVAAPLGELAWYPGDKDVAYQGSTSRCRRIGIFLARLDGRGSRRLTNACP